MDPREELQALRRMAELEARAAATQPPSRGMPPPDISRMGMGATGVQTTPYGKEFLQGPVSFPGALVQGLAGGAERSLAGITELGARAVGAEGLQQTAKGIREAIPGRLAEYKEAYPMTTGLAEFGGELALPAGVISKGAQAIRAAGAIAPRLAGVTAPLAESLATGGFRTGLQPGTANVLAKLAGGAVAGAATSAILSGGGIGETAMGGGVGAAVPIALPYLGKLGYKGAGKLVDLASGMAPVVKAGEIARKIAGPKLEAIKAATAANPELSAGQAAADVPSNAWQAFAESMTKKDKEEFVSALREKQGKEQFNILADLAQGPSQTASKEARKEAQNALNAITGPMMETELKAAGTAGEFYKKAVPKMYQKYDSMVDALQQTGQLYAYENQARQALLKKLNSPTPGWVSAKTIDQLEQNVLKAREATQEMNAMKWQRQDEGEFIQRQLDSLKAYGLKPIDTEGIVRNISQKLRDPRVGVSDQNKEALVAVADKIQEWTTKGGGYIDPVALHEIRKNVVNEVISQKLAGQDPSTVKKQVARVLGQIRPLIDDAIEAAGGTKWREALAKHSEGMREIERTKMASDALRLYQQSPDEFIKLVEGNNPKLVEDVFGPGNFNIEEMMGSKYAKLKQVSDELKRDIGIAERAKEGRQVAAEAVGEEKLGFRLPGFLSPKATITNKTLDVLEGRVNQKTMNALVKGMQTGKSANELLNTLPAGERDNLLRAMLGVGQRMQGLNLTTGAAQSQVSREQ